MNRSPDPTPDRPILDQIRSRTPARVLVERAGAAYRTPTQLELRRAHAAARDAVRTEFNLEGDLGAEFVTRWKLMEVSTCATSKDEYLLRPDLGRRLSDDAREHLASFPKQADLQVVIGDGLSVTAVATQVPQLLPLIFEQGCNHGWTQGRPYVVRHCRVGVLNDIGELLAPKVIVLLIGERPGLATAESLSAYMAFRPGPGHSDADRNLISNIHGRGVSPQAAATRIVKLAEQMMRSHLSGVKIREAFPSIDDPVRPLVSRKTDGPE
ncbi:MAG TPA: ethanolamine ammonia-lyase subunit EutC [Candidatus Angelobacter sp.]|jgi:ethanolamine ammonia-lyase small subunit|nr:ethanolamine ammonia-lyase subunit EutC [Candidatus Angelobacter sp.]